MVAESFDAKISQEQIEDPTYFAQLIFHLAGRLLIITAPILIEILSIWYSMCCISHSLPCLSHMEAAIPSPPMFWTQMPGPGPVGFFLLPYTMVVLKVFSEPCLWVCRLHKRCAGSYHILSPVVLTSTSKHGKLSDFKVHCTHHFSSAYFTWATGLTISGPYKIS